MEPTGIYQTTIPLSYFVGLSSILFCIGIFGLLLRKGNIISILMSVEIMLLGVNINFIAGAAYSQSVIGQIFTLFVLCVAAAEVAVGLTILILYFKQRGNIDINLANKLKDN